jgi:predicted RNA-binding protein with PIN domain
MEYLIIDGHNAIYKIPALAKHTNCGDEERRKALVVFLSEWKTLRLFPGNITIVFDSKNADHSTMKTIQGIKCIFATSRQDADEKIKSMIRSMQDPKAVTVITDDNNIANNCSAHGAIIEKPQTYFQVAGNKRKKEADGDDKKIGSQAENDITNMLKKKYGIK